MGIPLLDVVMSSIIVGVVSSSAVTTASADVVPIS